MKIVVTGGAGFIASQIVDAYIERGHEVHILDDFSTGQESNLNPKATVHRIDIAEPQDGKADRADQTRSVEPSCGADGCAPFGCGSGVRCAGQHHRFHQSVGSLQECRR